MAPVIQRFELPAQQATARLACGEYARAVSQPSMAFNLMTGERLRRRKGGWFVCQCQEHHFRWLEA